MGDQIESWVNDIGRKVSEMEQSFQEIQQPRSTWQIEHYVVGQHDTQERQFVQTVLELQIKWFRVRRAWIHIRRLREELSRPGVYVGFEREEKMLDLEEAELSMLGARREFDALYAIYSSMPKFTYEQIQAGEEKYWRLRLARQAAEDILESGRIGRGNQDAIWQSGWDRHPGLKIQGIRDELLSGPPDGHFEIEEAKA